MATNTHIKEALDYYLAHKTRHALMLTGAWGSGKTHFIGKFIEDWQQANPPAANADYNSACYISLYGIRTIEELQKQLFIRLYPMKGKVRSGISKLGINGISLSLPFINVSIDPDKLGKTFDKICTALDGTILFFDDLERCKIPVDELFGFINQFVEHNGQKVVLIANEEKITDDKYASIKEKLVGTTLELQTSSESVLKHFIGGMTEGWAKDCVKHNKDAILRIFSELNIPNYRSLRIALYDFSRLFDAIKEKEIFPSFTEKSKNAQEARLQLLMLMLVIELQYRANILDLEFLLSYRSKLHGFANTESLDKAVEKDSEIDYLKTTHIGELNKINKFFPDYYHADNYGGETYSILPYTFISAFLLKGSFHAVWAKQHLQQHFLFADKYPQPLWFRLHNAKRHLFNEQKFQQLMAEIGKALAAKTIIDMGEILQLASDFIFLQENDNFYPDFLKPVISSYFIRYMDNLPNPTEKYEIDLTENAIVKEGYLFYHFAVNSSNKEFKSITEHYRQFKKQSNEKQAQLKAKEILSLLYMDINGEKITEWLKINNHTACFQYLDGAEIAERILNSSAGIHRSYTAVLIGRRYENVQEILALKSEREWFDNLKIILEEKAAEKSPRIKRMAGNLINSLFSQQ